MVVVFKTIIMPTDLHIIKAMTKVNWANKTEVPENINERESV